VKGEEALGGFSLKEGTQPSTPIFLLKTRPEQMSSSSEAVASTIPFCLRFAGAGAEGVGAGITTAGAATLAPDGPALALSLEAASASILLFSAFSTMPTQENNNA